MRKLALLLILFAVAPSAAKAQAVELFGGYSYLRLNPAGANLNGWNVSGTYKTNSLFGLTADFSGQYGSPFGPSTSVHSFLFGPQLSLPTPIISPYLHALIGASRETTRSVSDTALATALGGGIDTKIAPFLSFRVIQVDYLGTRFGGTTENNLRISTGLVVRF